jgi:hypothetical protein
MALASEASQHKMVDMTEAFSAKDLLVAASSRIRALGVARGGAKVSGIDTSMPNAEKLAEWATSSMYAPAVVLLESLHWSGSAVALTDFTATSYNRVGVLLGDTLSHADMGDAAIGLLLGRIARIPVQRHIASVADGPVSAVNAYIGSTEASKADAETIHAKGYISFRTFVGKAGYFFSDDSLTTSFSDDYRSLARRRTVDKAFRLACVTLLQFLNSEMPVTDDGKLAPGTVKSWQNEVERAIMLEMGNAGNLGRNLLDLNDTGVRCLIDPDQNIISDSRVEVSLQVKPYGYAKYINVKLGFMTTLA